MCYRMDEIFPIHQLVSSFLYWEENKAKLDIFLSIVFEGHSKIPGAVVQTPLNKIDSILRNFNSSLFEDIRYMTNPFADLLVISNDEKYFYAHRSLIFGKFSIRNTFILTIYGECKNIYDFHSM